jgi:hypothetical protein
VNLDQNRALLRAFDNHLEILCQGCKPSSKLKTNPSAIEWRTTIKGRYLPIFCVLLLDEWQKKAIYGGSFGSLCAY